MGRISPETLAILALIIVSISTLIVDYKIYLPMKASEYNPLLPIATIIGIILLLTMIGTIDYYLYSTYKILAPKDQWIMEDLLITFFLIPVALLFAAVRAIDLLFFGTTEVTFILLGNVRYIDPIATAIFVNIMAFSAYFYMLWGLKMSNKYKDSYAYIALLLYIIVGLLCIHPDNNYSNYLEFVTPIKILARISLFLAFSIPATIIIREVISRIMGSNDKSKKIRMGILLASNILIILSLIFWVVDGFIPMTYSPYIILSNALFLLAFLGVSISIIWPEWISRYF